MYATAIKKIVHGISPENKNHSQTRGGGEEEFYRLKISEPA